MTGSTDNTKLSALQNWQRRKAYDPRSSIQRKGASETGIQSVRDSKHRDPEVRPKSSTSSGGSRGSRRLTNGSAHTAPVETEDCLAALATIKSQAMFSPHCSVVPNILLENTEKHHHHNNVRNKSDVTSAKKNVTPEMERKKRSTRSALLASPTMHQRRHADPYAGWQPVDYNPEDKLSLLLSDHEKHSTHHDHYAWKYSSQRKGGCQSLRENRYNDPSVQKRPLIHFNRSDTDLHYPDVAVDSIRYKIEKLTNFIVRLRKRIEKDYAEQGTCSPGDDVFGDEAVGATVAGMSTGMHPVVASSLKNLRILEFNAQEIFNLLYPNEIDLWEPLRACLDGTISGEQMYNEAKSMLTDHASNSITLNALDKNGECLVETETENLCSLSTNNRNIPSTNGDLH